MFNFDRQVDFFRKKINLPTEKYTDLWNEEHDWAFVVAGAANMELVADLREAVSKAIMDGTTLEEFRKDFRATVKKHGWTYKGKEGWRTKTIYDTNMSSSYQAGRYEQLQEVKEYMPYWEYVHNAIKYPREDHQILDGKILPADDPWWQHYYPPNGYGCKCTVHAHNDRSLEDSGKILSKDNIVEFEQVKIGETDEDNPQPILVQTPKGVNPSFHHIPGKNIKELESRTNLSRTEIVADLLFKRAENLDPMVASVMVSQLLEYKPAMKLLQKNIGAKVDKINDLIIDLNLKKTIDDAKKIEDQIRSIPELETFINVGVISPTIMKILQKYNADIKTSVVSLASGDIAHSMRLGKKDILTKEDFVNMPIYLKTPEKVFIDYSKGWKRIDLDRPEKIVFLIKTDRINEQEKQNYRFKLIIRLNTHTSNTDWKVKGNPIITGAYQSEAQLKTSNTMVEILPNDKYGAFKQAEKEKKN